MSTLIFLVYLMGSVSALNIISFAGAAISLFLWAFAFIGETESGGDVEEREEAVRIKLFFRNLFFIALSVNILLPSEDTRKLLIAAVAVDVIVETPAAQAVGGEMLELYNLALPKIKELLEVEGDANE